MKLRLKHSALVLLIGAGLFLSCRKPEVQQTNRFPPAPPPPPSLSGQVFLFDSLTWAFVDGRYDVGVDAIYLNTPKRADLFPWLTYHTYLNAEVLMKFDTASNWVDVKSIDLYVPSVAVQFRYWIYSNSLYVDMVPLNYQLIDRKATIKVKFL